MFLKNNQRVEDCLCSPNRLNTTSERLSAHIDSERKRNRICLSNWQDCLFWHWMRLLHQSFADGFEYWLSLGSSMKFWSASLTFLHPASSSCALFSIIVPLLKGNNKFYLHFYEIHSFSLQSTWSWTLHSTSN